MTKMKRSLAMVLAVCLMVGLMPVWASAAETTLAAEELVGQSRLDGVVAENPVKDTPGYAADELVTVIVEMTQPAVLEKFSGSAYATKKGVNAGTAVSAFLATKDAETLSAKLLKEQDNVLATFRKAHKKTEVTVLAQWTNLLNGMAVQIPYGQIAALESQPGVARVQIQKVYAAPELPETEAGIAGYSYDMVGINDIWGAGYTGEGMLVAVLDTGLDLEYSTYYENGENVTGVRRVHEAFSDDSFQNASAKENVRWTNESLEAFLAETQLNATTGYDGNKVTYEGNALYKTLKVPFAADYADGDVNVRPTSSDHGTHVAGTVAGYAQSEEGEVIFSGIAPDAQILAMKVFDDETTGAPEYAILSALEDAAILGADVMNLSLGSDNGFAEDDTVAGEVYDRLTEAGILFMISAGNSYYSSMGSNYGDYDLAANPETSMVASPSTYPGVLSVASVNSTVDSQSYLQWADESGNGGAAAYIDPTGIAMRYMFGNDADVPVQIIPVDGYGTYEDYYNAGFRDFYGYSEDKGAYGIALVKRGGGISFLDKVNVATQFMWSYYDSSIGYYVTDYPVRAVLVYDEDPTSTELIYMNTEGAAMASAFISGVDGAAIAEAAKNGPVYLSKLEEQDRLTDWDLAGQMSEFSSWGAGNGLELKPEITAPGGNIWSAVMDATYSGGAGTYTDYTGSYAMMSGTSMAAPHMTGITALVKQAVINQYGLSNAEAADLAQKLMVSTAVPVVDPNGTFYSPRVQGAGLVNANAAITSPVYATVNGGIGKLELKDDPEKTGSYTLNFTLHNISDEALTYDASVTLLRPATDTVRSDWGDRTVMTDSDVTIKTESLGSVTVPAKGQIEVSKTVSLTEAEKAELDALFPNGTYVEGYVVLTNESNPTVGLPMLAFFGDWTSAPIFDSALWIDEGEHYLDLESTWGTSVVGYFDGYNFWNLGQNVFDNTAHEQQPVYYEENIALSADGLGAIINDFSLHQLRNARMIVVEVSDKESGEVYYRDFVTYMWKDFYYAEVSAAVPASQQIFTETSFDGTDMEGNPLPDGTQCVMTITAYGDGDYPTIYDADVGYEVTDFKAVASGEKKPTFNGHEMDMTGDVISFDVLIDTTAPKLVNSAMSFYEDADGKVWLEGTFVDDGSIASIEVFPQVKRSYNLESYPYGDPEYSEIGMDENNPFYSEMIYDPAVGEWTFRVDVSSYEHAKESFSGENYYYKYEWTGNVFIFGGDYAGNDRGYAVKANTTPGIVLSTTSARLHVGSTFDLSVIDNSNADAVITRVSSNPEVATIDEHGHIEALAPGQTVITVSNGFASATCVVAVEEWPTEVIDFDLSIDHFSGLKADGSIVVNVVNLQPADVVITENSWKVYEDDEEWAGLLDVAKDSTTGRSGRIMLNATYDDGEAPSAGSGRLEVTINGVTRTLTFDWDELYESYEEDGLISDQYYAEQTVYINQGESADLVALYRQTHSFIPVELYTMEGYESYSYDNPTTPGVGLVLDGPNFATNGQQWSGKLVALPGYELPAEIKVCTRYDDGYESEMYLDSYYGGYTYNPATGEIVVANAPYGADNTLVIRADGVENPDATGGVHSGTEYTRPDGTYGPFDWTVTEGNGTLVEVDDLYQNNEYKMGARYTPAEPGVSYITASSKDGQYSVNFAVICQPIQADTLDLDTHNVEMEVDETYQLTATLSPEPTLESDKALTWTSFNEDVVTVDENGLLTAVGAGYAYIKVVSDINTNVNTYCVVYVKDHVEEVEFQWSDDYTSCTALVTCTTCGKTYTADCEVIITVAEASCDEDGEIIYTAVHGDFEESISVMIPCFGHDFQDGVCTICGATRMPEVTASNDPKTGKIKLTWDAVEGAVKYQVYRATTKNGDYKLMYTTSKTSYTNTKATPGKYYYYYVVAVSESGVESRPSDVVGRTCDLAQPKVTASNVAATGKVKLTWDAVEGAVEYKVYRATAKDGKYSLMYTTTGTSYTNSKAEAGKTYYYKVMAVAAKTAANSVASEIVSRTCDLAQPKVTGKVTLAGNPKLSWSKVDGAVSYKVYRATSENGTYKLMKTTTGTSYTNTSVTAGKTYYYKVVAVANNTAANSAASEIVKLKAK